VTVLDASAILALVHNEPGADQVAEALPGSMLSTVNLAEVVGKLVDAAIDASDLHTLLLSAGVTIEPFLAADAELAGAMRSLPGGRALSLGDRCCLALTVRSDPPDVITGDRVWTELDLPIRVVLFR
jgi:ribonuclease VapC